MQIRLLLLLLVWQSDLLDDGPDAGVDDKATPDRVSRASLGAQRRVPGRKVEIESVADGDRQSGDDEIERDD